MWKAVATEKGRKEFWKFVKNGFKVWFEYFILNFHLQISLP
jgi:hypothetical protein